MTTAAGEPRWIHLRIQLLGGHVQELRVREDAPELHQLFGALARRGGMPGANGPALIQIPMDDGRSACTIPAEQLVSIISSPPVVVEIEEPPSAPRAEPSVANLLHATPVVIDDFLGIDEQADLLSLVARERDRFEASTAGGRPDPGRRNAVIMNFTEEAHAQLLANRLLVWLPVILKKLGKPMFPLGQVELQMTASNDGDFYRAHFDTEDPRVVARELSCIYYFHREPKGFSGGALRLYDAIERDGRLSTATSFQDVEPRNNRLIVFPAMTPHELRPVRCPSRDFLDGRFAVTGWLHRAPALDEDATFGWGHFRCASSDAMELATERVA